MLDNLTDKQKKIVAAIATIVVIGVIYFIYKGIDKPKSTDEYGSMLIQNTSEETTKEIEKNDNTIVVHIAGAVKNPGVVKLKEGSRIEDAISLAGGLADDADITNVNLAYVLDDGTKINIPRTSVEIDAVEEEPEIIQEGSGENVIEDKTDTESPIRTGKYK